MQWLWKPRQIGAVRSKQLRWPVPKPSARPEPRKPPRLWCSMRNMANTCRAWRSRPSERKAEVITTSSHPIRLPYATVHYCLGELWLPCIISYWASTLIASTHSTTKDSPCRRTAIHGHSFHTNAQTVSKTEKVTSFNRADGEHAYGQSHPDGYVGRTSQPQEVRDTSLFQVT